MSKLGLPRLRLLKVLTSIRKRSRAGNEASAASAPKEFRRVQTWYHTAIGAREVARRFMEQNPVDPIALAEQAYTMVPPDIRDRTRQFQKDAARNGATDVELDFINHVLTHSVTIRLLSMGDSADKWLTTDERSAEFETLADALTKWLRARLARRTGARTAPMATGFQRMSSKQLEADAKKPKRKKA